MPRNPEIGPLGVEPLEKVRLVTKISTIVKKEPNSRTLLIGEQPNPSKLVHPEDRMSRHRGAKQSGQYVLSRTISLLSLASFGKRSTIVKISI
ncbi:Cw-hydrolase domain-containing protein [Rhizoctonia solani AG-1 IA]|uniref:Cw-hydrolase domain-containing protein n=1 Tax=Thanatephorus cucumeris (strain AG1-IA) TaxID=983506 RepID=L8WM70_THACA|nr:Cw-hydrolase domain-containing protein [Rhizoctonia solani AG-1 IA]